MAYLADRYAVIGRLESTSGTPETLIASDLDTVLFDAEYVPMIEQGGKFVPAINSHAHVKSYSGTKAGQIKLKFIVRPGGAANSAPKHGKFWQSAGYVAAAITTVGYKYSDLPAGDEKTMTLWYVRVSRGGTPVGIVHKIAGAMCDGFIEAPGQGKEIICELTFTGKHVAGADLDNSALTALGVLTSPDSGMGYVNSNTTIKLNNVATPMSSWKLAFGRKVEPEVDTADANGGDFRCFAITERAPTFSCNPAVRALATIDPIAAVVANTLCSIDVAIASRSPSLNIIAPQAQYADVKFGKGEGLVKYDLTFDLLANGLPAAKIDANLDWDETHVIRQGAAS
jgi:hypothetical protein